MSKLSTATPAPALVDAYLGEIALAYRVPWLSADEPANTNQCEEQSLFFAEQWLLGWRSNKKNPEKN